MTVLSLAEARNAALDEALRAVRSGQLVVFPTDTVYGVGADPFNPFATAKIFQAKSRARSLPLPVLVANPPQAWALASQISPAAVDLARAFWPGALTIVLRESDAVGWDLGDTNGTVAFRMPDHPDALALLERTGPLAATSANRSGEPTPPTAEGVRDSLGAWVAVYLDGGEAPGEVPSTIVDCSGEAPRLLRQGAVAREDVERVAGPVRAPGE